jgi:phosphogluconate dehydratase
MQSNGANRQGIQWHFVPCRIRRRVAHILSNDRPRDSRFSSPFYRPPRARRVADERGQSHGGLRQPGAWFCRLRAGRQGGAAQRRWRRASASSPPITTCSRRISLMSDFPELIRAAAREAGGVAMVAGGVPAMCDGVTQGEAGMELSLFSRDVIALATAVALSHQTFDAAVYLGICDKIVPGLVIGALSPSAICRRCSSPAGRCPPACRTRRRSRVRQLYAEGKVSREELLEAGGEILSRPRHLHVLRHRQHQPDDDGDHGPASAGRGLHQPQHAIARCADPRGRKRALAMTAAWQRIIRRSAEMLDERSVRQRGGRPACDGRFHQPHAASDRHGRRRRHCADLGRFVGPGGVTPLLCRIYPNGWAM